MKERKFFIIRTKRVLNKEGKEVKKKELLRCSVNAAVPFDHRMITSERF